MKSFKFILKNKKTALMLYLEDLIMFLFVFIPVFTMIKASTRGNYYSINFTIDYVVDILPQRRGIGAYALVLLFLILLYFIVRLFLLSGIFSKFLNEDANCLKEAPKHFWKFLGLFFIYLIILLIASGIVSFPLKKVIDNTINLKTVYILKNVLKTDLIIITLIISLFHNAARIKTVRENKFKPFAKPKRILPFFGYRILAMITLFVGLLISYKLIILNSWLTFVLAFLLFQLTIFFKIAFKLSAYKSLT